ncbi:acetoacetate--CoA ligase [bacterium]|nr:acetoacetate--CoA ligase [bacterium]
MAPPDPEQGPWWFPEGKLNFAANLLFPAGAGQSPRPDLHGEDGANAVAPLQDKDGRGQAPPLQDKDMPAKAGAPEDSDPAIIAWNENGRHAWLSWAELRSRVAALAQWMRDEAGIVPGDRVAAFMPNIPETVIAMLAAASLGAIWSSCSPDFGIRGVLDRFGQIAPKLLFCADGYQYSGKYIDSLERVRGILPELPSVQRVVVVEYLKHRPGLEGLGNALYLSTIISPESRVLSPEADEQSPRLSAKKDVGTSADPGHRTQDAGQASFELFPFNQPLYLMYSSGTTGLPKCMLHGAGGTLIQHKKELMLHTDLRPGERIFYFSTCGWMMWNWLVSALSVGATIVLYDGSPFAPRPGILWDMAQQEQVNVFGTSAKYIALLEKEGVKPAASHDLSALRAVLSTGSPLAPASFDYVYRDIKSDVQLASISGGTDIISCFALGNPMAPVWRGELQTRGLGMKVEVFDAQGNAQLPGVQGELVCTKPFPSMPVGFWNDPDGSKYRKAYFDYYLEHCGAEAPSAPGGVWRHGDWVELCDHSTEPAELCGPQSEGMTIYGRSDATLNPGGVRIGTAEIYRVVETMPEIVESLVVGQDWQDDVRIVLFVRLRGGESLGDELRKSIQQRVRAEASPHHVPRCIVQVQDIPRTISGKIVELAVREVIHGREVKNVDALANPAALDEFRDRVELR